MPDYPHGPSATVQRVPRRATYDAAVINAIIDACPIAHIGFTDQGGAVVIPSIVWRVDSCVFTHGAQAGRLIRSLVSGARVCITFTRLDGLVLARSAYHHSMNFRSAVVFGQGELVTDPEEKVRALDALMDWLVPGRNGLVRPPSPGELEATGVVRIPIAEASAKINKGPPNDLAADLVIPVWAGVVPRIETWGTPVPDGQSPAGLAAPQGLGAG